MVVPRKHPKIIIFSRKTLVVGYHHLRKPPYHSIKISWLHIRFMVILFEKYISALEKNLMKKIFPHLCFLPPFFFPKTPNSRNTMASGITRRASNLKISAIKRTPRKPQLGLEYWNIEMFNSISFQNEIFSLLFKKKINGMTQSHNGRRFKRKPLRSLVGN